MSALPPKPLPNPLPLERPYWEHAKRHVLALQKCRACGTFRFPASPICASCDTDQGDDGDWTPVSGRGVIVSWVVFHRSYFPSFAADIPYNVALIALDEGPVMCANLVGIANERIASGQRVRVVFDDVSPEFSIPKFEPAP